MIEHFYLNEKIFFWINSLVGNNEFLDLFFVFLAEYLIYILIFLNIFYFWRLIYADKKIEIKEFFLYFSSAILAWVATKVFRLFVEMERPFSYFHIDTLIKHPNIFESFPSGHSTIAFALAFSVFFYNKKIGYILLFLAFLISIGRILVGVHYPLDVFVGGFLGFFVSFVIYKIVTKYVG